MILPFFYFFTLVLNLNNSTDNEYQCIAPLRTPPPIAGMKSLFAGVILRHGSRTPQVAYLPRSNRGYWICDSDDAISPRMYSSSLSSYRRFSRVLDPRHVEFLPNCRSGDLLIEGMQQHQRLGEMYHDYLYNQINLFDEAPKNEEVYARSTDIERTFRSCQAFLNGAFPPQKPFEYLSIVHGSDFSEILRPGSFCKEENAASAAFNSDIKVLNYSQKEWKKLEHVANELQLDYSLSNLQLIADWIYTYHCNDRRLPSFVTQNDILRSHKILGKLFQRYYEGNGAIYASYSMREVLRIAETSLKKRNPKFAVFSAHDSTVFGFLEFLNKKIKLLPPYASHILFEIFKLNGEEQIRWSYNGEVIPLNKFDGNNYMPYFKFVEKVKGIYDMCHELP